MSSPPLEGFKQRPSGMDAVNGVTTFGRAAGLAGHQERRVDRLPLA